MAKNLEKRSLEDELNLVKRVQEKGFSYDPSESEEYRGWTKQVFRQGITNGHVVELNSKTNGKEPIGLKVNFHTHPNLGVNVSINPIPFTKKYHEATERPVTTEKALELLSNYIDRHNLAFDNLSD